MPRPRSSRPWRLLGPCFVACLIACASSGQSAPARLHASPQPVDSILAVATFDRVWQRIAETHFDTAYGGVDWRGVRDELRPRAAGVSDIDELRRLLREMLGRLRESHFGIIPREASSALREGDEVDTRGDGVPGLDLRLVDGQVTVIEVWEGAAADRAGVRPGWILLRVGDTELERGLRLLREADTDLPPRIERMQAWAMVTQRLSGPVGSTLALTFLNAEQDTVRVALTRDAPRGEVVRAGNLPPMEAHLEHAQLRGPAGSTVGVIRFNIWLAPIAQQFARAMDEVRHADGIVLDLRGNLGGLGAMVMGISGHFLDTTLSLGTMRTRTTELRFVSNPQRVTVGGQRVRPYDGPLVILVDEVSVSTSEIFAAGMQAVGRARVVGDTTTGQALPAHTYPLPTGDILMHAFADFRDPHGERIEGRGVIPDEHVPLDRQNLLAGRDLPLERALAVVERLRAEGRAAEAPVGGAEP